jgi:hypothetical protein
VDPLRRPPVPFTLAEELRWQNLAPATDAQVRDVLTRYLETEMFPRARAWLKRPVGAARLADVSAAIGDRLERVLRERHGGPLFLVDDPEARARFAAIAGRLATPEQAAEAAATGLAVARFLLPLLALHRALPQIKGELRGALAQGRPAFEARIAESFTPERVMAEFGLGIGDAQAESLAPVLEARRREMTSLYDAAAAYLAGPAEAGFDSRRGLDRRVELEHDALVTHQSFADHLSHQIVQSLEEDRILEALQVAVDGLEVAEPIHPELAAKQGLGLQVLEVVQPLDSGEVHIEQQPQNVVEPPSSPGGFDRPETLGELALDAESPEEARQGVEACLPEPWCRSGRRSRARSVLSRVAFGGRISSPVRYSFPRSVCVHHEDSYHGEESV